MLLQTLPFPQYALAVVHLDAEGHEVSLKAGGYGGFPYEERISAKGRQSEIRIRIKGLNNLLT